MAGALATGTHGTGAAFGNLSAARWSAAALVAADGVVHDLGDRDRRSCCAARVSLGALGVLSQVQVQTVPAFRLEKVEQPRPLADVLAELDELVAGGDHVELYALPWSRTRAGADLAGAPTSRPPRRARWRTWLTDELLDNTGPRICCSGPADGSRALSPALGRLTGALASAEADGSTTATGCSPASAGPVHRVGVGAAAGRRGRGGAGGDGGWWSAAGCR